MSYIVASKDAMDSPVDGEAAANSVSLKGGDSNMMILLGKKKKNKNKGKNQVLGKGKKRDTPKLSKSQQRKLRRLEEEKEKDILLSKSMENLEKYKIREDAYSLMWSSANLGQVETVREKRRREVQFAKTGLVLPQSDRPAKRRAGNGAYNEIESEYESNQIESKQGCNGNDSPQPVLRVREIALDKPDPRVYTEEYLACGNRVDAVGVSDGIILDKDIANENTNTPILEDQQSPLLTSSNGKNIPNSREGVNKIHDATMRCGSNPVDCPSNRTLRTPTLVHVSRPKEVEENRTNLPIVMMEQEIMEAINDNTSVIICGETGCGKTTQVPQFLFEAGYGSKHNTVRSGIIGVTQPRRVAVLATAKRVAFELGLRLGKEVGFQVRYDKRVGDNCSIKFMTDGILLRELLTDFLLKKYSTIILDEAHERSLNTDILIGMLSRIIQTRQKIYEDQNKYEHLGGTVSPETRIFPLRLILMSATLRVEDFVSGRRIFSNPPPVIEVPTRQYPVTIHFSKRTEIVDYIGQAYKKIMSIHKRLPPGGILVFVTGQREVEFLCQKLHKASREMTKSKVNKELPVATEDDYNNGFDMKELDEAFQIQENSTDQQTDRFSSFDGDYDENYEDDFDSSYDSDDDSDFEVLGIDGDFLEQQNLGNVADILGEDGKLTSLKAAFEALAGKNILVDSEANQVIPSAPGAQDQSTSSSEKKESPSAMCVFPLYAMLPASAQLRVFEQIKEGERLVVVATNVAETSLTIPGIKYVVDTGREKVKNYNSSNGMESYEIQWISKASAAQRSGRAGRTGPGHCYRLYSSAVFNNIFADFSGAEISKMPVDGVVLLMKSMGIDKVANFPFPTPPEVTALIEAERCLKALEALDTEGRMTPLGKAMARYPMSPRHSRMLLTTIQIMKKGKYYARRNLVLGYAVAAAAALSVSNPFVIQFEGSQTDTDGSNDQKSDVSGSEKTLHKEEKMKKKKLKELSKVSREKFSNPTSDALSIAYALLCFELSESQVEFCNDNALHLKTMEEMSKLRKQLMNLVFNQSVCDSSHEFSWDYGTMEDVESAWKEFSDKTPLFLNEEELLGQAICAGWADRVARRIRGVSRLSEGERKVSAMRYQACMVKETVFLHRWSNLSRTAPDFLIYNELVHSKRPYIHGATSVKPDWLVKYARSLCSFSAPLPDPKPYYEPETDEVFNWVTPTFGPHLWQLPLHSLPVKDDFHRVAVFAYSLLEGIVLPCVKQARKFMAASPAIILKPEASGHKRVGNLLSKMKSRTRTIYSCAMLRKVWTEKPKELYPEILDWFQVGFHDQYDDFWAGMQREVQLDPPERFPKLAKKQKNRKKSSSVKSRVRVV